MGEGPLHDSKPCVPPPPSMDNTSLLQELRQKVLSGEISREDILRSLPAQLSEELKHSSDPPHSFFQLSVSKVLFVLGAVIVCIGLIVFTSQIWSDIGSFGRIAVTLGLGFIITALGAMLSRQKPETLLGPVFFAIGGVLIPGGAMVMLSEMSTGVVTTWPVCITFGVLFAFYLLMNATHRSAVLTFFTIGNGTAFIYLLVESIIEPSDGDIYAYLTMVVGMSYLLLARHFTKNWNKGLTGILFFVGTAGIFIAGFTQVTQHKPWHFLYFLLIIAGYYAAVFLRSRIVITIATIALLGHLSFITGEYFADSFGWPVALIILGFLFIGLGYGSIGISKKYIQHS